MGRLIYSSIMSIDGFTADTSGAFDWSAPDEEVHAFVNDLQRSVGTYLYGRRMYGVMSVWQTWDTTDEPPVIADFATLWRGADKRVYSATLSDSAISTPRTQLVRSFDVEEIRELKVSCALDLSIGGPGLAAAAIRGGLVDEYQLFFSPIAVGGGNPFFPADARVPLTLLETRQFTNGVVFVRYGAL
ncbi:dihydrofolate reductase family protein [Subtercola endophyticus]|uniref:dihydrofolate reductase family protein n=1 Tax=Subtercola endophyticus TaxID=2895559 RepID=UPI001E3A06E2|nr:dihydrofolate reductase family protein [Subtercola endophyticus]UFS59630.1 dihydrofolate reductase family protein [Subtercola endophyticus]